MGGVYGGKGVSDGRVYSEKPSQMEGFIVEKECQMEGL